jgi:hypothetical protein
MTVSLYRGSRQEVYAETRRSALILNASLRQSSVELVTA